jgi:Zn-dependent protease
MTQFPPVPALVESAPRCAQCFAALPASALSCPSCHALVHASELKRLAGEAQAAEARADVSAQLEAWRVALTLLPPGSSQYASIAQRVEGLSRSLDAPASPADSDGGGASGDAPKKAWRGGALGAGALLLWKFKAIAILVLSKGKLLLLGLSKGTTFFSMLAALGVYWTLWGWKFALGFVLSIYVHEMGHVAAMRRYGLAATAPMFIPGFGALIRMKQRPATAQEEARIGLAGPIWGFGAAVACFLAYVLTEHPLWAALTHTGAMINLFNLMPVWQLDGGHAFTALNRTERWIATAVAAGLFFATGEGLLVLVAILAGLQAAREAPNADGDRTVLIQFCGLLVALGLLMRMPVPSIP